VFAALNTFVMVAAALALVIATRALLNASSFDQWFIGLAVLASLVAYRLESAIGQITLTGEWVISIMVVCVLPDLAPVLGVVAVTLRQARPRNRIPVMAGEIVFLQVAAFAVRLLPSPTTVPESMSIGLVAAICLLVANNVFYTPVAVRHGIAVVDYFRTSLRSTLAMMLVAAPLVAMVTLVPHGARAWTFLLALGPLLVMHHVHSQYIASITARDDIAGKATLLARTNLQLAAAMVRALDHRDAYTAGHSAAVAVYTRDIAREMGFDEATVRQAHLAGLLHDIGKIGVPGRVLNKTAPLDDEEYELMKTHASMGADILAEVDLYADIAHLVRYHHERIDGRGYPDRLEGEIIPAISRIIAVADTYSAMTTDRPYREGMPTEQAMTILEGARGTQLDADFTDAFLRILASAAPAYQRGTLAEFEVEVAKHRAVSEVEAEVIRVTSPRLTAVPHALGDIAREAA